MLTYKLEHLSRTETTGKTKVGTIKIVVFNDGIICDIRHIKIDYKFPALISEMLALGYIPL